MAKFLSVARNRAYVYRIVLAAVPLLLLLGLVTGDEVQVILNIAAAVLSITPPTLALHNLTPDEESER